MKTSKSSLPLGVVRGLRQLGADIRVARLRQRIRASLLAERAGVAHTTLIRIERGDPGVGMGNYASVLWVLGFLDGLTRLAQPETDAAGLTVETLRLPTRVRGPRRGTS